jgi:hypothetical protein
VRQAALELIARHRRPGVVVDANLLLLLLVGEWSIAHVETFRRTRSHFVAADFARLGDLLHPLDRLVTTVHILTEVSNLASQTEGREKAGLYRVLAGGFSRLEVRDVPLPTLLAMPEFFKYGLTDAALVELARRGHLILTIDFPLSNYVQSLGLAAINYTTLSVANIDERVWS